MRELSELVAGDDEPHAKASLRKRSVGALEDEGVVHAPTGQRLGGGLEQRIAREIDGPLGRSSLSRRAGRSLVEVFLARVVLREPQTETVRGALWREAHQRLRDLPLRESAHRPLVRLIDT